jgi:predicted transcriptional regulator of viral defense system
MKRTSLTTVQREILERLLAERGLIVSTQDVIGLLSYETAESKRRFVSQLQQAGWLVRIKNGIYQIADISSLGVLTVSRYTIAQLLLPESYISFHAALQHHGLFDQSLQTISSLCLKQKAAVRLQGSVYHFVATKEEHYFGFRSHGLDGKRVQIADPEKAIIDLLQFHRTSATVDLVLETLRDNRHQLQLERLTEYALRSPIAVQRAVGFLFDLLALDTRVLAEATSKSRSVTKLTPESDEYHGGWRLYYEPFFAQQVDDA